MSALSFDKAVFRDVFEHHGRSPSARETRAQLVLATQAREGPNTQDKAERFMAEIDHLLDTKV